MNCKKGDLAYVVPTTRRHAWAAGRVVTCVELIRDQHLIGNVGWLIDPPLADPADGKVLRHAADASLRPIRDPGEDATDETLLWVPSPVKETA